MKKNNFAKKTLCLFLAVLLTVTVAPVMADSEITVTIDGEKIDFDVSPQLINGRTMVPLRAIFEALGATVDWDDNTQTVTSTRENTTISLTINNHVMYVNETGVILDSPACLVGERTLVPVRAVSEAFGTVVDWDDSTSTVIISTSGVADETIVAKIGDRNIYAYELVYFMRMGATKEEALEQLNMMKVFELKAKEYGLSATEEQITELKEQIAQQKADDEEYYNLTLDALDVTEEQMIEILMFTLFQDIVNRKITEEGVDFIPSDEEVLQYYNDNFLMADHILFATVDENRVPIDDEVLIAKKQMMAQEVSDKIAEGASFDDFVFLTDEPSRDEDGMLFLNTGNFDVDDIALSYLPQMGVPTMVTEFEAGTAALEIGEVSEPVKSDFGFHIIRRKDLPTEGDEFEVASNIISVMIENIKYNELVQSWITEYETSIEEKYFNALTAVPYSEDEDFMVRLELWEQSQYNEATE